MDVPVMVIPDTSCNTRTLTFLALFMIRWSEVFRICSVNTWKDISLLIECHCAMNNLLVIRDSQELGTLVHS